MRTEAKLLHCNSCQYFRFCKLQVNFVHFLKLVWLWNLTCTQNMYICVMKLFIFTLNIFNCLHSDYLLTLLHLRNLAIAANTVQETKT